MLNLSIPARLASLTTVLLALLVGSNLYLQHQLNKGTQVLGADVRLVDSLRTAIDASQSFGDLKYWLLELSIDAQPRSKENAIQARDELYTHLDSLERVEPETAAVLRLETGALMDSTLIAMEAYDEGNVAQGNSFLTKSLEHIRVVDRRLDGLVRLLEAETGDRRAAALADARRAEAVSIVIVLLGALLGAGLTVVVLRSINVPLRELVRSIHEIAGGDLDAEIPRAGRDEIGTMSRTLAMYRESLAERERLTAQNEATTQRLNRTRTRLMDALESISEGFSLYDSKDRLVLSNSRYREIVYPGLGHLVSAGMTFEEATRLVAEHGLVADAEGRVEEWVEERLAAHRAPRGPLIQSRSDGRWLQVSERKTEDGSTVAVYEDVTRLKQREQELALANREKDAAIRELNAVLDAVDYGILFMDADLNVRMTNRAYRRIWRIPEDFHADGEILNITDYYARTRPLYGLDEADWDSFLAPRIDAIKRGVTDPPFSELADGTFLRRQVIELPDGGRMITYFDITELKSVEESLRRSEERYALALRGSNDGLWDWDAESDLIYLSPRFKAIAVIVGDIDHLAPHEWQARIHPEDLTHYRSALGEHLRGNTNFFSAEYRVRGDDGQYRWVQVRGLGLRGEDGRVYRMAGSLTDISSRKESEIALRVAKEQAESATRAKSQFLANMSHELRTPLNAVIGITEMLKEEAEEEENEDLVEPLARIAAAGRHLLSLIDNILDLSKIEAHRLEVHVEEFDVQEVVRQVTATIEPLAAEHGNRMSVRFADDVDTMRSDATRVRQIMLNLLGNACKFTENGAVSLTVRREKGAGDGSGGDWITMEFADTGIGMSPEQQRRLFEEFAQVDNSTTRRYGGTGLGLVICRRLCEILGGGIEVSSEPGVGTTFTVRLPVALDSRP